MASDPIPRSLLEPPTRQLVHHLAQQRLMTGSSPTQGVKADVPSIEVHLGADQAAGPRGIDLEMTAQEIDTAGRPGPPQVDDLPARRRLEVRSPILGEGSPPRGLLDPRRGAEPTGGDILSRLGHEALQRLVHEAGPDLGLPAAVVA